jgi:anti-sigma regulatory factor (Ser/Thr protein kinase)
MTDAPVVRLDMPARPEGVGVVRQALTGVADGLALDGAVLSDAKMAVTEACTNAVVHAYPDGTGRLDVEMYADEAQLTVVVRDAGTGLSEETDSSGGALGLGLPLIQALSDSFELRGAPGEGTEVRMGFLYERQADPAEENPITGGPGPGGRWDPSA